MNTDWSVLQYMHGAGFLADAPRPLPAWHATYLPYGEIARFKAAIRELDAGVDVFSLEHRVLRRDGSEGWVRTRAVRSMDADGVTQAWVGGCTDISDRMQAEQALRNSEERFRTLTEALEDVFYILDLDEGRMEYVSPACEHVWGRPADLLQQSAEEFLQWLHPGDRAAWKEAGRNQRRGLATAIEYRILLPDGTCRWIADRSFPIPTGTHHRCGGVATDITQRKEAELALRASRKELALEADALRLLQRLSTELIRDSRGSSLYDRLVQTARVLTRADSAMLQTLHEDGWQVRAHTGFPVGMEEAWARQVRTELGRRKRGTRSRLLVEDVAKRPSEAPTELDDAAKGSVFLRGLLAAPLLSRSGRLLGWISTHWHQPHACLDRELRQLDILCRQAADLIERESHEARLTRYVDRTAFLLELTDVLGRAQNEEEIQHAACRRLRNHLHCDRVFYIDMRGEQPTLRASHPGLDDDMARPEFIKPLADHMLSHDPEEATVANMTADPDIGMAARPRLCMAGLGSFAGAVIRRQRRPVGLLVACDREPRTWNHEDVLLLREVGARMIESSARAGARRAVRESEERLRVLTDGIPQLLWRSSAGGAWTWSSGQWQKWTGQSLSQSLGEGWLAAVHPQDRDRVRDAWSHATAKAPLDIEFRVRKAEGGPHVWHHTRALPLCSESGSALEWLGTTTDIKELKHLQQRQALMVTELEHRTRNLLSVVMSVADRMAAASPDLETFSERFREQVAALARVQGLMGACRPGQGIAFDELLDSELAAIGASPSTGHPQVKLSGAPDVKLEATTVQTVAFALHELATNAVKHGALSHPQGRLSVTWRRFVPNGQPDGETWLRVHWQERGIQVDLAQANARRGYGRELIEHALPYQLDAQVRYRLGATGLSCCIELPVPAVVAANAPATGQRGST